MKLWFSDLGVTFFAQCCSDAGKFYPLARSHGEFSANINSIAGHTADLLFFLSYRFHGWSQPSNSTTQFRVTKNEVSAVLAVLSLCAQSDSEYTPFPQQSCSFWGLYAHGTRYPATVSITDDGVGCHLEPRSDTGHWSEGT